MVDRQRLHEAGRNVDEEAPDVTSGDGLKVRADSFERPAFDKRARGFDHRPVVADELNEPPRLLMSMSRVPAAQFREFVLEQDNPVARYFLAQ